jgi:GTP cyclohydrolase IB
MYEDLPDIQLTEPDIKIPISQVGVDNVSVPFLLELLSGGYTEVVANVAMRTNINDDVKGISMSRLLRTLNKYLERPLKHFLIEQILKDFKKTVGGDHSFLSFKFKIPIMVRSPVTDNMFPMYYDCKFEGQLIGEEFRFFQKVIIQYSSYCPCSAELCGHLEAHGSHGYPHAQRSFAHILIETKEPNYVWLENIISSVEKVVKTLPYPIVKRVDEQRLAEIAGSNTMFVEDAIRRISVELNNNDKIYDWYVKCIHQESIHPSDAIAINFKGIENGFNNTTNI